MLKVDAIGNDTFLRTSQHSLGAYKYTLMLFSVIVTKKTSTVTEDKNE